MPGHEFENPTGKYKPTISAEGWWGFGGDVLDQSPVFSWWDVPRMLRDERIQKNLRSLVAPLARAEWKIKASSADVANFVNSETRSFWRRYIPKIFRTYYKWGAAPFGVEYVGKRGKVKVKKIDVIETRDARPVEWKKNMPKAGEFAGFTFPGGTAVYPYAGWFAGSTELNRYYDWPRLRGAYNPWIEKNGRTGAKHSRRLAAASAWDGGTIRYPQDSVNLGTEANPVMVTGQQFAIEMMQKKEAGTQIALPNSPNNGLPGKYAWDLEPGRALGAIEWVARYPADLDLEIDSGMGVPTEVHEATENGGWSGRSLTFEGFYNSLDELVGVMLDTWTAQVLVPLMQWNFGKYAWCEIEAKPLAESAMKKPEGVPTQPGNVGRRDSGNGGSLFNNIPGMGEATNDDSADFSQTDGINISKRVRDELAKGPAKPGEFRRAVLLAMLQIQQEATESGNPKSAQPWLDELADLADDPQRLADVMGQAGPNDLGWTEDGVSSSGRKRWINESGQRRYQESKPGSRAEARQKREASDVEASKILEKVTRYEATADDIAGLADHLPAASLDKIRFARRTLGATFGGATRRDAMLNSVLQHVAERVKMQRAGEEKKAGDEQKAKEEQEKNQPKKAEPDTNDVPKNPVKNKVYNVDPKQLKIDPKRFQFKLNTDNPQGVTSELKGVKFNPDFAGVISVWLDPADGQTYVVNGHHRHDLASRTDAGSISVRYIDAGSAQEARGKGALINIAEGRGTSVDAAKFMRDTGVTLDQFAEEGISLKGAVARDAVELSKLSDGIFNKLTRGEIDQPKSLAIASNIPDTDMQDQFLRYVEKVEDRKGIEIAPKVLASMAKDWAKSPTRTKVESTLFGDEESKESLFHDRHELKSYVDEQLAKEARDFEAVSSEKRAERVAGEGNVLETDKNRQRAATANRLRDILSTQGEWSNILDTGAEEHAEAKSTSGRNNVKRKYLERIREALSKAHSGELQKMGGGRESTPETGAATGTDDGSEIVDLKKADEVNE